MLAEDPIFVATNHTLQSTIPKASYACLRAIEFDDTSNDMTEIEIKNLWRPEYLKIRGCCVYLHDFPRHALILIAMR